MTSYPPSQVFNTQPPTLLAPPRTPPSGTHHLHTYVKEGYSSMGACSLSRVSPFRPLWEVPWVMPLQSPPSLFLACGLLHLFQSSKDPPVFSSKEPFDVLNDKARHHGGCVATAPCRHPGGAAARCQLSSGRLKCFVSDSLGRLCC